MCSVPVPTDGALAEATGRGLKLVRRRELLDLDRVAARNGAGRGRRREEVGHRQRDLPALKLVDALQRRDESRNVASAERSVPSADSLA